MAMDPYSGDPKLFDSGDGGDLLIQGGQPVMGQGLQNAAYLSHFLEPNWWGWSSDPANPQIVDSGNLLALTRRAVLTPALLNDAESAAKKDLAWMLAQGVAKSVECSASIVALGVLGLEETITEPDGTTTTLRWKLNWAAMNPSSKSFQSGVDFGTPPQPELTSIAFQDGDFMTFQDGARMTLVGVYE